MIHTTFANKCLQLATAKITSISGAGLCYLGFSSTAPMKSGSNFTEPSSATYPSYERIQLAVTSALTYTDMWGAISNGVVANAKEFVSRECTEENGWPTFSHFGIFDCKTGGTPIISGVLRDPSGTPDATTGLLPEKTMKVDKGEVAVFREGTLQLTFE